MIRKPVIIAADFMVIFCRDYPELFQAGQHGIGVFGNLRNLKLAMQKTEAEIREQIAALQKQLKVAQKDCDVRAAKKLARTREDRDITQMAFAKMLGFTRQQMSNIELGKTRMSLSTFRTACEILKVSADEILGLNSHD